MQKKKERKKNGSRRTVWGSEGTGCVRTSTYLSRPVKRQQHIAGPWCCTWAASRVPAGGWLGCDRPAEKLCWPYHFLILSTLIFILNTLTWGSPVTSQASWPDAGPSQLPPVCWPLLALHHGPAGSCSRQGSPPPALLLLPSLCCLLHCSGRAWAVALPQAPQCCGTSVLPASQGHPASTAGARSARGQLTSSQRGFMLNLMCVILK